MADYNYGQYKRLFKNKNIKKAFGIINQVADETGIGYCIVGGSAVYLHVGKPPVDYPDIDIMLDTDKRGVFVFAEELRTRGFEIDAFESSWEDAFMDVSFRGLCIEMFSSQEDRKFLAKPAIIREMRVKPIESLIMEKLIRMSYPDVLMAIDLLASKKYHKPMLKLLAARYLVTGRLHQFIRIADAYAKRLISKAGVRKYVKRITGTNRLNHS